MGALILAAATCSLAASSASAAVNPRQEAVDVREEIECLALTIYFEARGEPDIGKLAVGHVVMNRMHDRRYPGRVCGVVRQGGERPLHRCQFSWWCDGRSDKPRERIAWQESDAIAHGVYWGYSEDPTDGALWYHADYVSPSWVTELGRGPKIGHHIFYRNRDQLTPAPVVFAQFDIENLDIDPGMEPGLETQPFTEAKAPRADGAEPAQGMTDNEISKGNRELRRTARRSRELPDRRASWLHVASTPGAQPLSFARDAQARADAHFDDPKPLKSSAHTSSQRGRYSEDGGNGRSGPLTETSHEPDPAPPRTLADARRRQSVAMVLASAGHILGRNAFHQRAAAILVGDPIGSVDIEPAWDTGGYSPEGRDSKRTGSSMPIQIARNVTGRIRERTPHRPRGPARKAQVSTLRRALRLGTETVGVTGSPDNHGARSGRTWVIHEPSILPDLAGGSGNRGEELRQRTA